MAPIDRRGPGPAPARPPTCKVRQRARKSLAGTLRAGVITSAAIVAVPGPAASRSQEPATFAQAIPGTDITFRMVRVPGGSFRIGSDPSEVGHDADEAPRRPVSLSPFWMSTTEVTYELFSIFRDPRLDSDAGPAPGVTFPADAVTRPSPPYEDPSHGMSGPGRPATGMTRLSALRFARWLSEKTGRLYRLPTEAEWEYACRAGGDAPWGVGADREAPSAPGSEGSFLEAHAWYGSNSGGTFHEVGGKRANAWGLHDLLGNVAEWTLDPYDSAFYTSLPEDGSATDPTTGPSPRGRGVVRGGAFDDHAEELRCADRFEETPAWKRRDPQMPKSPWWNTDAPHVGLRLVSPARDYSIDEITTYWRVMLGSGESSSDPPGPSR